MGKIRRLEKEIKRELRNDPTGKKLKRLRRELEQLLRQLSKEKPPRLPRN